MPISNIEQTLSDAIKEVAQTYGIDQETALFLLQSTISDAYESELPAQIWEDGSISIVKGKKQETFHLSIDKLRLIKKLLSIKISHNINNQNTQMYYKQKKINSALFYMKIMRRDKRFIYGKLYKTLDKSADPIVMIGVEAQMRLAKSKILPHDAKRDIFKEGRAVLITVSSEQEQEDGTLIVRCSRRDKKVTKYAVEHAFEKLRLVDVDIDYKSWFNYDTNTATVLLKKEIERRFKSYLLVSIRAMLNCNVRFIIEGGENWKKWKRRVMRVLRTLLVGEVAVANWEWR